MHKTHLVNQNIRSNCNGKDYKGKIFSKVTFSTYERDALHLGIGVGIHMAAKKLQMIERTWKHI